MEKEHIHNLVQYALSNDLSIIEWKLNFRFVRGLIPEWADEQMLIGIPVNEKPIYRFSYHFFPVELHTTAGVVHMTRDWKIRLD